MKILELLGASKESRQEKELARVGRQLKRNQEKLVDDLEAKKDELESEKAKLESVTVKTVNQKTWNEEYHKVLVDLKLISKELEIAQEVQTELFL